MRRVWRFVLPGYLVLEAYVTLEVAARLGGGRTLLLLLLGVAAGVAVLRRERLSILKHLRRSAAAGGPIVPELLNGALRVAASILLIASGFISDGVGLALLIPALRRRLIIRFSTDFGSGRRSPVVIEGDYRQIDDPALEARRKQGRG
jgi:UPF0716 protein FxsA